jgi:hypothetical protein
MFGAMTDHEKPRNAASAAVIALRKALGMTQQAFAVEVLKTAITTIARYETSHPPRGDALLRLASAAEDRMRTSAHGEDLLRLRDEFRRLYIEEVLSSLGFSLLMAPRSDADGGPYGYLLLKLDGLEQLGAAQSFLSVIATLKSTDAERQKIATSALRSLKQAARKCNHPMAQGFQDSVLDYVAGGPDAK